MVDSLRRPFIWVIAAGLGVVLFLHWWEPEPGSAAPAVNRLTAMLRAETEVAYEGTKEITWKWGDREHATYYFIQRDIDGHTSMEQMGEPAARRKSRPRTVSRSRLYWMRDRDLLLENYLVVDRGREEIMDRVGVVLTVRSRHDGRPAKRLVVDERTGLLLSQTDFDYRGRETFTSRFSTLLTGEDVGDVQEASGRRWPGAMNWKKRHEGHSPTETFTPLTPRYLPEGFVEKWRYQSCCGKSCFRVIYSDGLAWIEIREYEAKKESERNVVRKSRRGSRSKMRLVVGDVEVRLSGNIHPDRLVTILESLAEVGADDPATTLAWQGR